MSQETKQREYKNAKGSSLFLFEWGTETMEPSIYNNALDAITGEHMDTVLTLNSISEHLKETGMPNARIADILAAVLNDLNYEEQA